MNLPPPGFWSLYGLLQLGEARKEDLVPEEGEEENGNAGEARGGDLKAVGGWEEQLSGGPDDDERDDEPREHGGDTLRPPLHSVHIDYSAASVALTPYWIASAVARLGTLKAGGLVGCLLDR